MNLLQRLREGDLEGVTSDLVARVKAEPGKTEHRYALVAVLALGEQRLAPELTTTGARNVLAGAFIGVVIPAALLAVSGVAGGRVPVNAVAWVAFVFPLACIAAFPQLLPHRVRPALVRAIG